MRVSVLIAMRNAEAHLAASLRSVQRQRFTDWECVVVDDGSVDRSLEIASAFAETDPRFRVDARAAEGVVAARNAGLARCRGEFTAILDADDLMHPRRLEFQLAALAADPGLAAVGSHVRYFPSRGLGPGMRAYQEWLNSFHTSAALHHARYVELPLAHPSLCFRSEILRRFPWRQRGWPEDWDLFLRMDRVGHRFGVVARPLLAWRRRPDSLSRTSRDYSLEAFMRCRAAFLAGGFLNGVEEYALWGYGSTGKALRRALLAHGKRPSLVVEVHPGRLGQRIHGAPVISPWQFATLIPRPRCVVSVAGAQARRIVRAALDELGLAEGRELVLAA